MDPEPSKVIVNLANWSYYVSHGPLVVLSFTNDDQSITINIPLEPPHAKMVGRDLLGMGIVGNQN